MQPPRLAARVLHILETGHAGILAPHLAASERADVEDVVEGQLDDPTVTNGHDDLIAVLLNHVLDERADAGAEVHQALAPLAGGRDRGERALAAPIVAVFGQVVAGPGRVVGAVVADLAQPDVGDDGHGVGFGYVAGRLLRPQHGAGIEHIDFLQFGRQPRAQRGRLAVAQLRQAHIPIAAVPILQINKTLSVTNEIQMHSNSTRLICRNSSPFFANCPFL